MLAAFSFSSFRFEWTLGYNSKFCLARPSDGQTKKYTPVDLHFELNTRAFELELYLYLFSILNLEGNRSTNKKMQQQYIAVAANINIYLKIGILVLKCLELFI